MIASLYIHVPFCAPGRLGRKCDYCDFFSETVTVTSVLDSYAEAALADAAAQLSFFNVENVPTVYIGGGTPSVLGAKRMAGLLAGIGALLEPLGAPAEFTVEANPETAGEEFLHACAEGGVSRLSLGVQSFFEPSRRAVNRSGDAAQLDRQLALAAGYFPGALSADLMSGLPFQTGGILLEDIERLLACKPAHVSLYSLIVEPETALGRRVAESGAAALSLPAGDEADSLWITGRDALEKAGFSQYEVSNFALPGRACIHNIRYWRLENWLGAGPAASGTVIDDNTGTGRRYSYPADIKAYLEACRGPSGRRPGSARVEELSKADLVKESLLMGFRYRGGPAHDLFRRRFGLGVEDCIPETVERWRGRGFFENGPAGNPAPSREGLLFLNGFLRDAFNELDHARFPGIMQTGGFHGPL